MTRRPASPGPLRAMEAAHARGASLLVLPEMFLTGYLIRDRLRNCRAGARRPLLLVLREKARALSLGLVVGCLWPTPAASPTTPW